MLSHKLSRVLTTVNQTSKSILSTSRSLSIAARCLSSSPASGLNGLTTVNGTSGTDRLVHKRRYTPSLSPFSYLSPLSSSASFYSTSSTSSASSTSLAEPKRLKHYTEGSFHPGQVIHGFKVTKVTPVPEYSLTSIELVHEQTNAQYLHIARADSNNVFSVTFKTAVSTSTGVPHILEHTALCGSKAYPCRDPFFKMLNRSMSTYMNAWTAADYTMYPFSTQNAQDFNNLLNVYLDATFSPLLRERDFAQEGWRLEHAVVDDPSSPLVFKGVVYNEMKGVFSDTEQLFAIKQQQALFPTSTYSHVSGGDPAFITNLTYSDLVKFHQDHYHPSNAIFYSYGDLPLEPHLELINEKVLSTFSFHPPQPYASSLEAKWDTPKSVQLKCAPMSSAATSSSSATTTTSEESSNEDGHESSAASSTETEINTTGNESTAPVGTPQSSSENTSKVAVSFVLHDIKTSFDIFAAKLLSNVLVSGPSSPFHRSLIESSLGSSYSPSTGCSDHEKQLSFSVGLQDVHPRNVDQVVELIDATFERVAREGVDKSIIDAALHQLEIGLKHQSSNFGIAIASAVIPSWIHGVEPSESLAVDSLLSQFREAFTKDPQFVQKFVANHFIANRHRLVTTMHVDVNYQAELAEEESTRLKQRTDQLSEQDKALNFKKGLELQALQNHQEDLSCLPIIKVEDVERKALSYSSTVEVFSSPSSSSTSTSTSAFAPSTAPSRSFVLPADKMVIHFQHISAPKLVGSSTTIEGSQPTTVVPTISGLVPSLKNSETVPATPYILQTSTQPTNGVTYFRSIVSYPIHQAIPLSVRQYTPLLFDVIASMGAGSMDYREFSNASQAVCGGVSASGHYSVSPFDANLVEQGVLYASHCLGRNSKEMLHFVTQAMKSPRFDDPNRLKTLLGMISSNHMNSLADSGHNYAVTFAARHLTGYSQLHEQDGGLTQLEFIRNLEQTIRDSPQQLETLLESLGHLSKEILGNTSSSSSSGSNNNNNNNNNNNISNNNNTSSWRRLRSSVIADDTFLPTARDSVLSEFASNFSIQENRQDYDQIYSWKSLESNQQRLDKAIKLPTLTKPSSLVHSTTALHKPQLKTYFPFPFLNVHHCAMALPSVPLLDSDHVPLQILARILTSNYLLREVREKGGAYGAGAQVGHGTFTFYSYRDPRCGETLKSFVSAVQWASQEGSITEQYLADAKLSILSSSDSPVAPNRRGLGLFFSGMTAEMRQKARDTIFATTVADLKRVNEKYLLEGLNSGLAGVAVLGPTTTPTTESFDNNWELLTIS